MNKLNAKSPLIWGASLGLAACLFGLLSLLGYNSGSDQVVRTGPFEFDPEIIKWVISFASVFVIPLVNSKWPGLGALLSKLLNIFVDPAEEKPADVKIKTSEDHFCDLHEIGLQFARTGDAKGIKLSTEMFERMLSNQLESKPEQEAS